MLAISGYRPRIVLVVLPSYQDWHDTAQFKVTVGWGQAKSPMLCYPVYRVDAHR